MNASDFQKIVDARIKALALRQARALLLADAYVTPGSLDTIGGLSADYKAAVAEHEQVERDYARAQEIMEEST